MPDLLVLCYHGISRTWPAPTSVTPEDFERHLEAFVRDGYRGATLSEALTAPTAAPTLVLTFDDAHRSVLELAAPTMARLGLPGTVFAPTDYVGSDRLMGWSGYDVWVGTEHERELRCMSWDELSGLATEGWEIGSHTCSHPRLSRIGDTEIARELSASLEECRERLGRAPRSVAYPYSDYDERAVGAAAASGYLFAVTVPRTPSEPRPFEWPRVGVYNGESARRIRLRARARRYTPSALGRLAIARTASGSNA